MPMIDAFRQEFDLESKATRRILERVPEDRLDWRPHEKSMTLGRLAGHVAEIPHWAEQTLLADELDFASYDGPGPFTPASREELLARFDREIETFHRATEGIADETLADTWTMRNGDAKLFSAPKAATLRSFVLSHLIHHRGQLTVYLRLLDVPVPATYGNSADENPFEG